jgi:hypothetical protein
MPPQSNLRPRKERHFAFCALCLSGEPFDDPVQVKVWLERHARLEHGLYSPYAADAPRSVTVLYQAKSDNPAHEDPTGAFLTLINWMREVKHLE